ncbi:MICAL-like protein 1 isoform X1 [Sinocyclocheilus anshuiensis]|uniref:MICAL-like protein 1 isoform X1 n=1 Tax=Sinocyclocheilus anshuiensis TaxID=1608454 RepID=UPI0007B9733E|nr:PREDICTED: MICAL-like protein 1 isoform X1 [Sinocyclocheilus anshuiensis]
MCSLKALQDWCGDVCEGYSDVLITDMSSSFTDGLAFCAIIHKHRPDLLDFHSLSKHNYYENMRLAFDVAERELGIPALLDPDELVSVEEPDLLSIITYVSQIYSVFRRNSHVSQKIPVNNESSSTKTQEQTHTLFSSDVVRSSDKRVCSVCHTCVHLIQRVLVKGHLYHRSCFRCSRCRRSLLPISFTVDSETGSLQCSYPCKPASDHDRPADQYSQNDTSETDGDRSETDGDRSETDGDRSETDGDRSETDGYRSEMDRDRSETDEDKINDGHLSTSSETDIQEPLKHAPRKRVEPQEPPRPTPRSPDHRPDNVLSQSTVRKEHPWMKLVDPGPWSRLPPAPAPAPAPSAHSRHRPVTFNPFLEDESKDEEKNPFSCETSVAHKPQTSSSVPSMHQAAAPVHGFLLIKRKVITDTRVSEKQVCEEQKKLEERLLELERRGVQLETEMRRRTNEHLLVDWFLLIHEKNMLVRRDTELVYMVKQQRLEDQQADVEFEIRRLFNKPEQDWSSDDKHQEDQLMSRLLSIIQQRNDIISSLDQDRQREEEEDSMLTAVIQRMEFLTQTDKQLDKCSRSFKRLQMFKKSSCKTENTSRRKKKNS